MTLCYPENLSNVELVYLFKQAIIYNEKGMEGYEEDIEEYKRELLKRMGDNNE